MRALVYTAPHSVTMQQVPPPQAGADDAIISVELAGICGSDLSGFLGHSARRKPPLILGHELVGRLADGRRVIANPLISCGHCRACLAGRQNLCESWRLLGMDQTHGAFAEAVAVPWRQVMVIPENMPSQRAVLTEPLANIVHLFRLAAMPPFSTLAIVGAGTMGALALLTARRLGFRAITLLDVNDERLALMQQLGAAATLNTASAEGVAAAITHAGTHTGGGFDLVLDASGSAPARQLAFDLCRAGGQVVLLGMGSQRSELDFVTSIRKEHRVVMSFAYTPLDFQAAFDLLLAGAVELDAWSETRPLEQGQEAFRKMTSHPGATLKMLLRVAE